MGIYWDGRDSLNESIECGNDWRVRDCVYAASVRLARTIYIQCKYGIFGRKSPNIRSYTVYIYGSGQL